MMPIKVQSILKHCSVSWQVMTSGSLERDTRTPYKFRVPPVTPSSKPHQNAAANSRTEVRPFRSSAMRHSRLRLLCLLCHFHFAQPGILSLPRPLCLCSLSLSPVLPPTSFSLYLSASISLHFYFLPLSVSFLGVILSASH